MFKEILKEQQPVVYCTLLHALEHDRLAHAYMFYGPSGTPKKETAYLLAQSLICEHEGFACETCTTCQRIAHNDFVDMIYIDGTSVSIKKDDIIKLQQTFSKTGLEQTGKKVYILDHAENATPEALNSLLKFLEEPGSDMTAILLVEQLDRILPTIVSRCQLIPFKALSAKQCYDAVNQEIDELDAYLLSIMIRQKSEILETAEKEEYQHARYIWKGMIEKYLTSPYDALLFLQLEGFPAKQKKYGKQAMTYFIDMLAIFFKDCMQDRRTIQDSWYQNMMDQYQKKEIDLVKIIKILMQTKDILLGSVNIQLLIDQMIYQMKEVTQ